MIFSYTKGQQTLNCKECTLLGKRVLSCYDAPHLFVYKQNGYDVNLSSINSNLFKSKLIFNFSAYEITSPPLFMSEVTVVKAHRYIVAFSNITLRNLVLNSLSNPKYHYTNF